MILSKYNRFYKSDELEKSILFNCLNGKVTVFEKEANKEIQDYVSGLPGTESVEQFLRENEYMAGSEVDGIEAVKKIEHSIQEQSDTLSLIFILTEQCNLRCVYCCEEHLNNRMSLDMQDKIVQFVEENIHKYRFLKVEWFGGEPLMCMDIIEYLSPKFIDICKKNRVMYTAVISTNGYLLAVDRIKKLKDLHVFAYQITIDGMKETHDAQRMKVDGSGSWDVIVNNLRNIRDNYKSNLVRIIIRTNVTIPIFKTIDHYMDFLQSEFGSDKRFSFLWRLAEDWGRIDEDTAGILCSMDDYAEIMKLAGKKGLRNNYLAGTLQPGARVCEAAKKNSLILFPSGIIGKCERNVCPEKSHIGTIDDLLVNAEKYLNCRLERDGGVPGECRQCSMFAICLGKACPFEEASQCGYEMKNINLLLDCILKCDDSCKVVSKIEKNMR